MGPKNSGFEMSSIPKKIQAQKKILAMNIFFWVKKDFLLKKIGSKKVLVSKFFCDLIFLSHFCQTKFFGQKKFVGPKTFGKKICSSKIIGIKKALFQKICFKNNFWAKRHYVKNFDIQQIFGTKMFIAKKKLGVKD